MRVFISKEKRISRDVSSPAEPIEFIHKRCIHKLLYATIEKTKEITQEQLREVFKKYPKLSELYEHLKDLRILLLEDSNDSLENAIKYSYGNGLAEGSVNN